MKKLLVFIIFIISITAQAMDVEIKVSPNEPVAGDPFNVTFVISSDEGSDPAISFDPMNVEVLSRDQTGVSTRTTYINGKLSVERNVSITYEMVSNSPGSAYLRQIKIELAGETKRLPTKRISILRQARRSKDIFAMAVVDKNEVYVNESLLVRYYLYNKVPVTSYDIKKFPKLGKFLKRYHQERTSPERVQYKGEIYTRRIIYTAQVFAEKPGQYKIDPITLLIQYPDRNKDPFSNLGLGMGFRSMRKKTVRSKAIKIDAKMLPVDNVPPHFTGLVGKHDFQMKINKAKYLVNEPVEIKFTVKGPGALELFESPKILNDSNLEEFETNSDLKIDQNFIGTKTFDMTYLGRGPVNITGGQIPMSYFDPVSEKFVTVNLDFNGITVVGSPAKKVIDQKPEATKVTEPTKSKEVIKEVEKLPTFIPIYKLTNTYIYKSKHINLILFGVLLVLIGFKTWKYMSNKSYVAPTPIAIIKRDGVSYSNLYSLISLINNSRDKDMLEIVKDSNLSNKAKNYFMKLIEECEREFKSNENHSNRKINKKYLSEFEKLIKSKYESIS
jgi:hypothetical protein